MINNLTIFLSLLVDQLGVEPRTSRSEVERSIQLKLLVLLTNTYFIQDFI